MPSELNIMKAIWSRGKSDSNISIHETGVITIESEIWRRLEIEDQARFA